MLVQLLPALVGIWLMASPAVLEYADPARANDRIIGPIVASLAIIAMWEIARPLRWVNVILGAWLLIAPWLLGHTPDARWNSLAAGALILALSLLKGKRTHQNGRRLVVPVESRAPRRSISEWLTVKHGTQEPGMVGLARMSGARESRAAPPRGWERLK